MLRKTIVAGLISLSGMSAGAQETMQDALATMSVFDCTAAGERSVYVFRSDETGAVRLITDLGVGVRSEDGGYAFDTPEGARRIGPDGYFLFRDGAEIKGVCVSATDAARATFPVITAGLLPEADAEASAETLASLLTIDDLRAGLGKTEAANAALSATLAEVNASLATTSQERDAALADAVALRADIEGLTGDLEAGRAALANEAALSETLRSALDGANADLESTEQARRALVASTAVLSQQVAMLEEALRAAKAQTAEAEADTEEAQGQTRAMRRLADAAITWIATLQVRSPVAVRNEMCGTINSADRPEICN